MGAGFAPALFFQTKVCTIRPPISLWIALRASIGADNSV